MLKNKNTAELARGLIERYDLFSAANIALQSGIITGALSYNLEGALFSGSQKIVYPTKLNVKTVSFWITLTSTTENIMKLTSSHSISVTAGTLAATGFATPTIRVNGVATTTITTAKSFVEIDTATAITCNDIQVGYIAAYGNFRMKDLKFWNVQLTVQEALDYFTGQTFNYEKRASVILPMTADCHDATNLRTLDVSGNGRCFTFGDGSTASTFPTKLQRRGYYFDSGDYLTLPIALNGTYSAIVMAHRTGNLTSTGSLFGADTTGYAWIQGGALVVSSGTKYLNGSITALSPGGSVFVACVSGVTLASATEFYVGTKTGLVNKFIGNIYYFALYPFALTPLQVIDATLKLQKNINLI